MSSIEIFQGDQIGGCVTVISAEHDGIIHRIMIDYGSSLPGSDIKKDFEYPWDEKPVDAVFFTHYHGDHVGRMTEIPKTVPIYMGAVARQVLINIREALVKRADENKEKYEAELRLLKNDKRLRTFTKNRRKYDTVKDIPGFSIEPYSVDHSAYDAYMFLIEAEDKDADNGKKVILHTGDFRGHGRRGKAMIPIIQKYVHMNGREVDSLIIEGTMMSRPGEHVPTETEMQYEARDYLKDHKYAFLICSSTNLDSLTTFYRGAQQAAGRNNYRYMFTYSNYFKTQLELFSNTAGEESPVYKFEHVAKLDLRSEAKREAMEQFGFVAVIKPEDWCEDYIDAFVEDYRAGIIDEMPVIIYSMWEGYRDKDHKAHNDEWIKFLDRQEDKGVKVKPMHTSGHASVDTLIEVINEVAPREAIYPMHTEKHDDFKKLSIKEELKVLIK